MKGKEFITILISIIAFSFNNNKFLKKSQFNFYLQSWRFLKAYLNHFNYKSLIYLDSG